MTDDDADTVPWRAFLREAERRLTEAGIPDPAVSARRIVEEASGAEGAGLVLVLDQPATVRAVAHFDAMLARRLDGEPLQYVLGRWGFRTLDLLVDPRVLIPRPETEEVVEQALVEIDRVRSNRGGQPVIAVDLGTGSGAIALALVAERTEVEVWATDRSADAVAVARANLAGLGRPASRVRIVEGSWFDGLPDELRGRVDVLVSNPPYIAAGESLPAEVAAWEPAGALIAGVSGLEAYEAIFGEVDTWLTPSGAVVVELAPHQRDEVIAIGRRAGFAVAVTDDLAGRPRIGVARRD